MWQKSRSAVIVVGSRSRSENVASELENHKGGAEVGIISQLTPLVREPTLLYIAGVYMRSKTNFKTPQPHSKIPLVLRFQLGVGSQFPKAQVESCFLAKNQGTIRFLPAFPFKILDKSQVIGFPAQSAVK